MKISAQNITKGTVIHGALGREIVAESDATFPPESDRTVYIELDGAAVGFKPDTMLEVAE